MITFVDDSIEQSEDRAVHSMLFLSLFVSIVSYLRMAAEQKKSEVESLEKIFEKLSPEDKDDVYRILYGKQLQ